MILWFVCGTLRRLTGGYELGLDTRTMTWHPMRRIVS